MLHHAVGIVFALSGQIIHGVLHQVLDLRHHGFRIVGEALRMHRWVLQQAAGAVVNHSSDRNQTPFTHRRAIVKHLLVDITHGHAVHIQVAHGDLAGDGNLTVHHVHHNTVLGQHHLVSVHTGGNG